MLRFIAACGELRVKSQTLKEAKEIRIPNLFKDKANSRLLIATIESRADIASARLADLHLEIVNLISLE